MTSHRRGFTAESAPVEIGAETIVMEHAVVRGAGALVDRRDPGDPGDGRPDSGPR